MSSPVCGYLPARGWSAHLSPVNFRLIVFSWLALQAAARVVGAGATPFDLDAVEVRYGFGDHHSDSGFHHAAAAAGFRTPLSGAVTKSWELRTRLDLAAGWMGRNAADATFFSLGPLLTLAPRGFPLTFEAGVSPTLVSENVFGDKNIGGRFQFTDTIGAGLQLSPRIRLGYHFVHISNAGIYERNPGVNFHVFTLGWRF